MCKMITHEMKYSKKVAMIFHLACFPKMLFCLSSRILQAIFLSCSQSSLDLAAASQQVIGERASFAVNQIVFFHLPFTILGQILSRFDYIAFFGGGSSCCSKEKSSAFYHGDNKKQMYPTTCHSQIQTPKGTP